MWWFARKTEQPSSMPGVNPRQQAEDELVALVPDLTAIADGQDVAVKIWLPEMIARTVKWLADYEGVSQSAWLRERLLAYVYGQVAMRALRIQLERAERDAARFSRRPVDRTQGRWIYKVPQLGKNTVAFKLWVNEQMRADLEVLANHAQVALSAFVREAVVADLLGRASLPERPEIMGQPTAAAEAWERGDEVPLLDVAEQDLNELGDPERVWQDLRSESMEGID